MPTHYVSDNHQIALRMKAAQKKTAHYLAQAPSGNITEQDILKLLDEHDAFIVSHLYTPPEIQSVTTAAGGVVSDSLDMARACAKSDKQTIVVCGVRFMGESAKILNMEKRVLMPDLSATCSLDIGCDIESFNEFCDQYPDRTIVVYANTSAEVKARADWVVTSSIAVDVIEHLAAEGQKILWAPDKHLGMYLQQKTNADMVLYDGACVVHEEFKAQGINNLKNVHPQAGVLAHPEAPLSVLNTADFIGSTTQIIQAASTLPYSSFIVATDAAMFHALRHNVPEKDFISAPTAGTSGTCKSCAYCPWMKLNHISALGSVFDSSDNEIHLDAEIARKAKSTLQRMLDFSS